jgi:spore coat polysaccharide biosynthesis protein SpsF
LCDIATNNGIKFFRGSEKDKLERWRGASKKYDIDFFITADGDDLFCSSELMDLAFRQYTENPCDFIFGENLVSGSFTYGIKTSALEKVCEVKDTDDTEMMWVYFTDTGLFKTSPLNNVPDVYKRSDIRMTLDYEDDFLFFSSVIEHLKLENFDTRDVLKFLNKNSDIVDINYYLEEAWKNNQTLKTNLVLKEV